MNRFRSLMVAIVLLASFAAYAQNSGATGPTATQNQQSSASRVDQHLQMLTAKLDLTADQQARLRPILQQMLDGRHKLMEDKSLSPEQRHQKMKIMHDEADRQARQILTEDQKKKLDALEAESHHEHDQSK